MTSGLFKTFLRLYSNAQCFHTFRWLSRLIGRQNHRLQRVKPLPIEPDFAVFENTILLRVIVQTSSLSKLWIDIWRNISIKSLIVIVSIERNLNFNNATIIPPLACKVCRFLSWTKIISIRLALTRSILGASLQLSFTPILPSLIFFARIFTVHWEEALPPSTSTSNQWLSLAVHSIILPNSKNFHYFQRHFQKSISQGCQPPRTLQTFSWQVGKLYFILLKFQISAYCTFRDILIFRSPRLN